MSNCVGFSIKKATVDEQLGIVLAKWMPCWIQNPFSEGPGLESWCGQLFGLGRSQWRDSVSSARVDSVLNGYLEKSEQGKLEGCA